VSDSFVSVAAKVAAARAQKSVSPVTYPLSGADTNLSRPGWFHQANGYAADEDMLDDSLAIQETGDVAHSHITDDVP
jgi:hypothetical protein